MQARNTTFGMSTAEFKKLVVGIGLLAISTLSLLTASMARDDSDANQTSDGSVTVLIAASNERFRGKLLETNVYLPSAGSATMSAVAGQTARFWEENLQLPGAISSRVTPSAVTRFREQNTWLPGSSAPVANDNLPAIQPPY
jgi:hypothetical protein